MSLVLGNKEVTPQVLCKWRTLTSRVAFKGGGALITYFVGYYDVDVNLDIKCSPYPEAQLSQKPNWAQLLSSSQLCEPSFM